VNSISGMLLVPYLPMISSRNAFRLTAVRSILKLPTYYSPSAFLGKVLTIAGSCEMPNPLRIRGGAS